MARALASSVIPQRLSIDVHGANVVDVLSLLAAATGENVMVEASLPHTRVTLHLHNVTFPQALLTMAHAYDFRVHREHAVTIVGSIDSIIRKYGDSRADDGDEQTAVIHIPPSDAERLISALKTDLAPGTAVAFEKTTGALSIVGNPTTIRRARLIAANLNSATQGGHFETTVSMPLKFARSLDVAKQIKGVLPDGSYIVDEQHNAILVTDAKAAILARDVLASLDVPMHQVMLEVRVVDVSSDAEKRLGVLYGGTGANSIGSATYTFQNKSIPIQASLNALIESGQARVLATPRLTTLNNREASLLIGQNYPVEQQTISGGVTSISVSFIDVGVKLRITPTIGEDGTITAELHPEFSAIAGTDSFGNPIVTNRKIDATLRVQRDETIILGGLLEDVEQNTITKVPLLGDIPLLGGVFSNRTRSRTKDDVMFLITPHVI